MSGSSSSLTAAESDLAPGERPVELRLPADGAYASVVRTLAAGLAARLDFTMDDIEDVRMVVSEAVALVLESAGEGELVCRFHLADTRLHLAISTSVDGVVDVDYQHFGWQVLAVLAEDAAIEATADRYAVRATVVSSLDQSGAEV